MCAIFGMVTKNPSEKLLDDFFLRFSHLQHRGQESVGIAYSDGETVWTEKSMGLITGLLTPQIKEKIIDRKPRLIIGQTRYSTSGDKTSRDMPPQWIEMLRGRYAIAHNGNIPELESHKKELKEKGVWFYTDLDTEFMLKKIIYLMEEKKGMVPAITEFIGTTGGSFSAALLNRDSIHVFRDIWGNRPLFLSEVSGCIFFGSETSALENLSDIVTIEPGVVYKIDMNCNIELSQSTTLELNQKQRAHCVFEKIYFARPDSRTFGKETEGMFRFRLGMKLASQYPVPHADIIIGMPDSGRPAAEGYAFDVSKPIVSAFVRDRYYIKRNFINPPGQRRSDLKYHLIKEFVRDKIIVLVDDSIVRGDTLKSKVKDLKRAGAKEVHLRISSPKLISPCYYGIDIKTSEEIIGSAKTTEEIREFLGADSLKYLDEVFLRAVLQEKEEDPDNFCMACFNEIYSIPIEKPL